MRRKRTLKHQPAVKLKSKQTLVYAATGFAMAAIVGVGVFFYLNVGNSTSSLAKTKQNEGYTSSGQRDWSDNTTWTKSHNKMNDNPGDNLNYNFVEIYGYINRDGDLKVRGKTKLTVHDTLWITGDLSVTGEGSINIEDGGVLVVEGNHATKGRSTIHNKGKLVVKKDLVTKGGSKIINDKDFYVFGTTSSKRGVTFNGAKNISNATIANKDSLETSNSKLYAFTTGSILTLPTTLTYFYARIEGPNVVVTWESARELNNAFFTVERSAVGANFENLARIPGAGNSQQPTEYSYIDSNPAQGISYYRIRQTSLNGKFEIFNTVAVFHTAISRAD